MTDSVAVALVTHNGQNYLHDQLASILHQTVSPSAVFLMDDRSIDGSAQIVGAFANQVGGRFRVHVMQPPRARRDTYSRIAANFELLLRAAAEHHDIILLSDQDDVWELDRIERQTRKLEATGALLLASDARMVDSSGALTGRRLRESFPVPHWATLSKRQRLEFALASPAATGATVALSSDLLGYALPVPYGWLHDRWLSIVAAALGGLYVDDDPVIQYREHSMQTVGTASARTPPPVVRAARKAWQIHRRLKCLVHEDDQDLISYGAILDRSRSAVRSS
jgi:glycosyltransferase involved in cell wall biosynthesis